MIVPHIVARSALALCDEAISNLNKKSPGGELYE